MKTKSNSKVVPSPAVEPLFVDANLEELFEAGEYGLGFLRNIANGESQIEPDDINLAVCAITNCLRTMLDNTEEYLKSAVVLNRKHPGVIQVVKEDGHYKLTEPKSPRDIAA